MEDIDWRELSRFEGDELQTRLLGHADERMAGLTGELEDQAVAVLPRPLQAIWVLNWLDYEVSQGTLLAYFYNAHGRHARLAVEVLKEIGASEMASVLEQACDSIAPHVSSWQERRVEVDQAGEFAVVQPFKGLPETDHLSALTHTFWRAAEADQWGDRLDDWLGQSVKGLAAGDRD